MGISKLPENVVQLLFLPDARKVFLYSGIS